MSKTELNLPQKPDYAQLLTLFTAVKGNIALEKANITKEYKALVGELGNQPLGEGETEAKAHTVVSYIAAKIAEVNGAATELEARVKDNEDAIALLNSNADVVNSVKYMIDQRLITFLAEVTDNNKIDTIKEAFDWIETHQGEYANLGKLVGTLPEDAGVTSVVAYIEKLVAAEKERAEAAEKANKDAIDAINNAETGILKQAKDYADTKKSEAIAAVQGETESTLKDLEDAFLADHTLTQEQMSTLLAMFPTSASAE